MKEYIKVTSGFLKGKKLEVVSDTQTAFVAKDEEGNIATIPFDCCRELSSVRSNFYMLLGILEIEYDVSMEETIVRPANKDVAVAFITSLIALKIPYTVIDKGVDVLFDYKVDNKILMSM